jgi:hypothetical protein
MTPFLFGFADELIKVAEGNSLVRVRTAPTEAPKYKEGEEPWMTRVKHDAKQRKVQEQVTRNVANRPMPAFSGPSAQKPAAPKAPKPAGRAGNDSVPRGYM